MKLENILITIGLVLTALSQLNPIICGPYTKNIERHEMLDHLCLVAGAAFFLLSVIVKLFRKQPRP